MKLCVKYRLNPTREQTETLEKLAFYATKLYNTDNWIRRDQWTKTGKIPNWYDQKKLLKTNHWYRLLPSQTAQAVTKNLQDNYRSWFKLRKTDPAAKPPRFRKKSALSPLTFYQQFALVGDQLTLVMSKKFRAETGIDKLVFNLNLWRKVDGAKMCAVLYKDEKWMAHVVYEVQEPPQTGGENVMAVDLGIVNLAATVDLNGRSKLYSGGKALAVQHYFNKEIARVQSLTAKQHGEKGSRAISRMHRKKRGQADQILHGVSKALVEDAKRNGVGTIVVGDLRNIRKKPDGKGKDWGRSNQKLHAWGFRKLLTQIRYKATLSGIRVVEVSERDTSKTCSACGIVRKANRVHRGLYRCKRCGNTMNADVNGAVNLLRKYLHQAQAEGSIGCVAQPSIWRYAVSREAHTL